MHAGMECKKEVIWYASVFTLYFSNSIIAPSCSHRLLTTPPRVFSLLPFNCTCELGGDHTVVFVVVIVVNAETRSRAVHPHMSEVFESPALCASHSSSIPASQAAEATWACRPQPRRANRGVDAFVSRYSQHLQRSLSALPASLSAICATWLILCRRSRLQVMRAVQRVEEQLHC